MIQMLGLSDRDYKITMIKNHRDRKKDCGCQGLEEEGNGKILFMYIQFQFYKMQWVIEMDDGDGSTALWIYLIPLNFILKND